MATKKNNGSQLPPPPPDFPEAKPLTFSKPKRNSAGHRVILYGPGGIGKTTLALHTPDPVFIDLDESLTRLDIPDEQMPNTLPVADWGEMIDRLNQPGWDGVGTIVLDTMTTAEEWCVVHVLRTVKKEGGGLASSVEGYGYGKGYVYVYEEFMRLLAALDKHARAGRHIVEIAHDCSSEVPNPGGEDFLRFEPRLQDPKKGKNSIRLRAKELADHVAFYAYDIEVEKGKGRGSGSRTIWPAELPHFMAKSRTLQDPYPVTDDPEDMKNFWDCLFNGTSE